MSRRTLSYIALIIGILSISLSAMFIRWTGVPGPVTSFYRMAIASALMLPFTARQVRSLPPIRPSWILFGMLGGLFTALDQGIWSIALGYTRVANATLINNIAPLWVALFAWLLWRQRLGGTFWTGLALTLSGMGLVVGWDFIQHPTLGFGDLLALVSSFGYAGYFLAGQNGRKYLPTLTYLWLMTSTAAVLLFGFNLAMSNPMAGFSLETYLLFLGAALVPQVMGHFSLSYALGNLPAAIVSPTAVSQPILTALMAIPLVGENLTPPQWIGGAVVLFGIYLVNRANGSSVQPEPQPDGLKASHPAES